MADPLERAAAYWYSLRYQTSQQIAARLRYWLRWRLGRRVPSGVRWNPPGLSLLSLFELHYFNGAVRAEQVDDWMAHNPPASWPGWHPYPASLRIVNWIRAFSPAIPAPIAASLAAQAAFLERNLEFHIGGNHLLENARALLAAGLFLDHPGAARWRSRGLELLRRQARVQVLPDGGHSERSLFYHLRMTELLQDAIALLAARGCPVPTELSDAAARMTLFAQTLRHQDGSIPLFHDCPYACPRQTPQPGPVSFPASGYYILENGAGRLIADFGAPGAYPNPGHHHAGIFSFEVSSGPRMVVVDSGTETYDPGSARDRLRSTAAHNTVSVDGRDQFQLWEAFRIGRRAWVSPVEERRRPDLDSISASHDGYARLGVEHRRSIVSAPNAGWLIVDDLAGRGPHRIESFLHLAPGITPEVEGDRICLRPLDWTVLPLGPPAPVQVIADSYSPALGASQSASTLVFLGPPVLPCRFGYFLGPAAASRLIPESTRALRLEIPSAFSNPEMSLKSKLDSNAR